MEAVRHIANPRFGAVIFRHTSPEITNEGGLWDEAGQIYPAIGGTPRSAPQLDYRFHIDGKPGGRVSFRHLQHEKDKYHWQGSQIPLICFDELTHFSESQFFYMMSRNRTKCGVKPYIRATCNPDAGSWVKKLLAPWVDRKFKGHGGRALSGEIRWFIRLGGKIEWGTSREDIRTRFGPKAKPKSITFIRASVFDNKILLDKDPEYLANLEAQTPVERARLLDGDWDVVNEGLVYPELGQCVVEVEDWPLDLVGTAIGGIDWGFRDPFAALYAIEDAMGCIWISWERYAARQTPTANSKAMPRDPKNPPRYWADPSQPGQVAEFRLADHDVVSCVHLGPKPIKARVATVTERIQAGLLKIRGDLGNLIDEAGKYRYPEQGKGDTEIPIDKDNHLMDALGYMVVGNDRGRVIKDEAPPETDDEREERESEEDEVIREATEEYYDPDNDQWWSQN